MLKATQVRAGIRHADWNREHRMEDVHGQRFLGYHHSRTHCKRISYPASRCTDPRQAIYWVETKGKTLEEIDAIFEGEKHSTVPDVEAVRKSEVEIDTKELEHEVMMNTALEDQKDR